MGKHKAKTIAYILSIHSANMNTWRHLVGKWPDHFTLRCQWMKTFSRQCKTHIRNGSAEVIIMKWVMWRQLPLLPCVSPELGPAPGDCRCWPGGARRQGQESQEIRGESWYICSSDSLRQRISTGIYWVLFSSWAQYPMTLRTCVLMMMILTCHPCQWILRWAQFQKWIPSQTKSQVLQKILHHLRQAIWGHI